MSGTHGGATWYACFPQDYLDGVKLLTPEQRGNYSTVLNLIYQFGGRVADNAQWLARQCNTSTRSWNRTRKALVDMKKLVVGDGYLSNPRADREITAMNERHEVRSELGRAGGRASAKSRKKAENSPPVFSDFSDVGPSQAPDEVVDCEYRDHHGGETPETAKILAEKPPVPESEIERFQRPPRSTDSQTHKKVLSLRPSESSTHEKQSPLPTLCARETRTSVRDRGEHPRFPEWYSAYPKKVARPAAARAYAAAIRRGANPDMLLATLRAYQFSPTPRWRPHPATWLNEDRYLDEVEHPQAALMRIVGLSPETLHAPKPASEFDRLFAEGMAELAASRRT